MKTFEIALSEPDLARCVELLQGLMFSQIQAIVPNLDEDAAYLSQVSLLRLREQLELKLSAIELAREVIERSANERFVYVQGTETEQGEWM